MGMSSGGGRRQSMSEINVTPFVDVMLVLLIIFMVTAPMTKTGVVVELPETKKTDSVEVKKPLDIVINSKNQIFIGKKTVKLSNLESMIGKNNKSARVEADKQARYGTVAQVLSVIKNKGITDIALITEEVQ
jgi:biopolymer transport protein TolR